MKRNLDPNRYGPWALVTGAARGIGAEFARQLAIQGFKLILVDVRKEDLDRYAETVRTESDAEVSTIGADLSRADFMVDLVKRIGDRDVGLLVNNAGISKVGPFLPQDPQFLVDQLQVNTRAVLLLTHHFANSMARRGSGGIINLSSNGAELVSAYNANYCATKAYDLKLAESLWKELKPRGVDVLGFMPGSTSTEGYAAQGGSITGPMMMSPEATVQEAFFHLGRRPSVVAGRLNRWSNYVLTRFVPRATAIGFVSRQVKSMFSVRDD